MNLIDVQLETIENLDDYDDNSTRQNHSNELEIKSNLFPRNSKNIGYESYSIDNSRKPRESSTRFTPSLCKPLLKESRPLVAGRSMRYTPAGKIALTHFIL